MADNKKKKGKKGRGKRRSKSKKKDAGKEKSKSDTKTEGKEEGKAEGKEEAKADAPKPDAAKPDAAKTEPAKADGPRVNYVNANPEAVPKNKEFIDKIMALFSGIKLDQITKQHREDLATVQVLIKNIQFRDYHEPSRICEVHLNEYQKAVIKIVSEGKVDSDDGFNDTMMVTVTNDNGKPASPRAIPTKINYPFVQLAFLPTKVVKT